jgi:hypothetical protein
MSSGEADVGVESGGETAQERDGVRPTPILVPALAFTSEGSIGGETTYEAAELRAQRSHARRAKLMCSRPNDQVGTRISQYPVSADAASPKMRMATPIPTDTTVDHRISRRCRTMGMPPRYWCEAYHIQAAIAIKPITSTNAAAKLTGSTYPAVHVTNDDEGRSSPSNSCAPHAQSEQRQAPSSSNLLRPDRSVQITE